MRVGILGGGESGVGAALLSLKIGHIPFVSDYGELVDTYRDELSNNKVSFEETGHSIDKLKEVDLVIKSPGIPHDSEVVKKLTIGFGIEMISEVEYAFRYCTGKLIGITGSNGKTTVTNLTHHLLATSGIDAVKGGNLGESFARLVARVINHKWYVIELSSFQLDDITTLRPDIGMILNITPDHLDRYDNDLRKYQMAKWKLSKYQTQDDFLLVGEDVRIVNREINAKIEIIRSERRPQKIEIRNSYLRGRHNEVNASFAIRVAQLCGVDLDSIQKALDCFQNDSHRMEVIGNMKGAEWINDSKATNIDAAKVALEAIDGKIVWIAGGVDKGNDYKSLKEVVDDKVRVIISLGTNNQKLVEAFRESAEKVIHSTSMTDAIDQAYINVLEGETVLLSPACASFDLFNNYKDRGQQFADLVNEKMKARV